MAMPFWAVLALFAAVVVFTHFLEGITGFGSTALSMPALTLLLGIDVAKPVLTLYTWLLCAFILSRARREVDWRAFGRMLAVLAAGLIPGIALYNLLPRRALMGVLAAFMILVSARGLLMSFGTLKRRRAMREIPARIILFLGGALHGAFSSGGPLIILYAAERVPEKSRFRATMCMIWLALNTVILAQMALADQLTPDVGRFSLWGLPALIAGTLLGDFAHRRIRDTVFTRLMYLILMASGILTAVKL